MTIDLHSHTTASDGDLSPAELLALAHKQGVTTLAITDHDTTDGLPAAHEAAAAHGITLIDGVELSAESEDIGDIHMLGYFVDITDADFQARLQHFREGRYHRGRGMVRKLNELGVPLTWEAVEQVADGAAIARPHIARALRDAGHVGSLQEAFDRYLADDKPAYVNRERMLPEEAVALIHSAGGVAVMAHPGLVKGYADVLAHLVAHGVDGVEVNHPKNSSTVTAHLTELATQHNLVMTGGSDFHRPERANGAIKLGTYHPPHDEVIAQLQARRYHTT